LFEGNIGLLLSFIARAVLFAAVLGLAQDQDFPSTE
jgi:hypothetical protein